MILLFISKALALQPPPKQLSLKEVAYTLYKKKLYFSAMTYAVDYANSVGTVDPQFKVFLEELISKTGTELLSRTKNEILEKLSVKSIYLLIAKKYFLNKEYDQALKYLSFVPSDHRHYPEAQLTSGIIKMSSGEDNLALESFNNCLKKVSNIDKNDPKIARYYSMIKDNCKANIGRLYYGQKKYDQAIKSFYTIDKQSYMWPYVLLEKGWAEYYRGDYNRSLGLLSTYNAPLMDTYFQPEVELLKSLSYFKLCLWGDALKVVDRYTENYKVRSEELKSILVSNINSDDYFFKLILEHIQKRNNQNSFMKNLLTQIQKRTKFNLDLNAYLRAMNELTILRKSKQTPFIQNLIKNLEVDTAVLKSTVNFFVKEYFYNFINEINSLSYQLFNLKLNVLSMQRNLEFKNEVLTTDKTREQTRITRASDEMYWTFRKEFWADELGDFVFNLPSRCNVSKRELEKEQIIAPVKKAEPKVLKGGS